MNTLTKHVTTFSSQSRLKDSWGSNYGIFHTIHLVPESGIISTEQTDFGYSDHVYDRMNPQG